MSLAHRGDGKEVDDISRVLTDNVDCGCIDCVEDDDQKRKHVVPLQTPDTDCPEPNGESKSEDNHADDVERPDLSQKL